MNKIKDIKRDVSILNEEYEDHDCHASPEDGCQVCVDKFNKE